MGVAPTGGTELSTMNDASNLPSRLGLRDRVQAVVYAYENGVVTPR